MIQEPIAHERLRRLLLERRVAAQLDNAIDFFVGSLRFLCNTEAVGNITSSPNNEATWGMIRWAMGSGSTLP